MIAIKLFNCKMLNDAEEELSTCAVAVFTAAEGECWRKPAKYFKNEKVLVSSPHSSSSRGPKQLQKY